MKCKAKYNSIFVLEIREAEAQIPEDNLSQATVSGTPIQKPCSSSTSVDNPRQLNRRLFDSPFPSNPRTSSTPFCDSPMPSTSTQIHRRLLDSPFPSNPGMSSTPFGNSQMPSTSTQNQRLSQEIFRSGFGARKRCLEELFGDIQDIDEIEHRDICETIIAKRQKTEEEIDFEMIERILELRKQRVVEASAAKFNDLDRLEALQKFKQQNLSSSIPKYPFIPVTSDGERIYVRFHSEDFEAERIREIQCGKSVGALMSREAKEQMWANAQKMV